MKKILLLTLMFFCTAAVLSAQRGHELKGRVTDATNGEPIAFASVHVQGTTAGVSTDADGFYVISVPENSKVMYSFIGYKTVSHQVGKDGVFNVELEPDSQRLDETIVVAFGTSTKEAFTGSATVLDAADIAKSQTPDVTRSLEGMVAGVQMTTSTGTLGEAPAVMIRGISSISAASAPLFVVDGIPYSGDMDNLNAADIESITVQKDAASNSLYGARGANGVIMITTKRAKAGDAVVNVDAKWGWNSRATQTYDVFTDPADWYEALAFGIRNRFYADNGTVEGAYDYVNENIGQTAGYMVYTVPEGEAFIGNDGKINPNATLGRKVTLANGEERWMTPDNWMNEAYRNTLRQEYNISVSGSTGKASLYASFGYLNNKGIVDGSDMYRYTARLRADYQAKKWLKIGANVGYTNFNWNNGNGDEGSSTSTGNIFAVTSSIAPIYPLYVRDGAGNIMKDQYGWDVYDYGIGTEYGVARPIFKKSNALQQANLDRDNYNGNAINGTMYADLTFLKYFKFTANVGLGLDETRSTSVMNKFYGQFVTDGGIVYKGHSRDFDVNLQQILTYDQTYRGGHHLNVMLGHEYLKETDYSLSGNKSNMFSDENDELDGAVVDGQGASSERATYNVEGYFARAQYDFAERYFVNASYRRDASSNFHPDHRWGNFWAAGAAWLINKESWMSNVGWVDMLKLKASAGQQGNDGIGALRYVDRYSILNNSDMVGTAFTGKGNKDITWETNTNYNVGADFSLWASRLSGSVEYFYRKTTNMLYYFYVPQSLGYSGYYDNIGSMRNQGIEIDLHANIMSTRNFNWNAYLNMTHYTNKVLSIPEENKTLNIEGHAGFTYGSRYVGEGLPLNTWYLESVAGVDPETGKALWWKDIKDENGKVTGREKTSNYAEATQYLCGNPTPKLYGGFGTSLDFYGFDFSVAFTYSIGGLAYDSGYQSFVSSPSADGSNFHKDVLKAWSPENKNSDIPAFMLDETANSRRSDRFLTDASYLNIQNAQFGYTLPNRITKKFRVSKLRVYATCDNIWYWSKRQGFDPRYSFTGNTNMYVNLPVRTLSGGINIVF